MCTAIEYDAVSINEATEAFWRLAQDRYLAYSYGEQPSPKRLLATVLELMPQLSQEFGAMRAFAEEARRHPFQFMPFEPLTIDQVRAVMAHAEEAIGAYRPDALTSLAGAPPAGNKGWLSRIMRAATGRGRRPPTELQPVPPSAAPVKDGDETY
jgi:hypothetical protein